MTASPDTQPQEPPVARALAERGIAHRVFRHTGQVTSLEQAAAEREQQPGQVVRSILFRLGADRFALVLVVYGREFMAMAGETTPFLRLDKGWWYAAIPVTGALMAIYSLVWIWRVIRRGETLESTATLVG